MGYFYNLKDCFYVRQGVRIPEQQPHIQQSPGRAGQLPVLHLLSLERHPPPWENWNSRRPWAEQRSAPGSDSLWRVSRGATTHSEVSPCTLRCHRAAPGAAVLPPDVTVQECPLWHLPSLATLSPPDPDIAVTGPWGQIPCLQQNPASKSSQHPRDIKRTRLSVTVLNPSPGD